MKSNIALALSGIVLSSTLACTVQPATTPDANLTDYTSDLQPKTPIGTQVGNIKLPGTDKTPVVKDPAVNPGPGGQASLTNIKDSDILTLIDNDVSKLNPADQAKTRYFSLHIAANAGVGESALDGQRQAFTKILNSLSTKPRLLKPEAVDQARIVYRINLDDMGMSAAEFDAVIGDHYPFHNEFQDIGSAESIANEDNDESLRRLLQTDIYLIRMDWFNATAALPILYEKFMRFPDNLSDFEDEFLGRRVPVASLSAAARRNLDASTVIRENGVNKVDLRIANIVSDQVIRTGFDNSNVSFSNRIVERHEGKDGGYYISYDFFNLKLGDQFVNAQGQNRVANQRDLDEHNINKSPLGPKGTNASNRALEFNHDGGEVIFTLPNGLFGYYLVNAAGDLLDKGPINVVRQNTAPAEFSLSITNGHSCMSCHNAGLLVQPDTIQVGIGLNKANFLSADLAKVNKAYQPETHVAELEADNANFMSAMKEMGIDPLKPDPVDAAYRFYNRPLQKADVIAELGINERDFNLLLVDPEFSGIFNPLNNQTGFVNRAVFQAIYPEVVTRFKQEVKLVAPRQADFVVNADCMDDDAVQMDTCIINPTR